MGEEDVEENEVLDTIASCNPYSNALQHAGSCILTESWLLDSMGEEDLEEREVVRAVRQYKRAAAARRIVPALCEPARLDSLWDW